MVVEGEDDKRLAIECDGDRYHGPDKWEADMRRQRILERAGWQFWRSFASTFVMHRAEVVADLLKTLEARGITPIGNYDSVSSRFVEHVIYSVTAQKAQGNTNKNADQDNSEFAAFQSDLLSNLQD